MDLQVLVATMGQKDDSLLQKMNINSKAIIGNQGDCNKIEVISYQGHEVIYYSSQDRGVGLNRNNIFMRATEDICLFADDDVVYEAGYRKQILKEFERHPKADVILFNVISKTKGREDSITKAFKRLHAIDCVNYCAYRIAVRTERIRKANIYFSLLFGGGAKYGSGEDCIFIRDCIKKGLKLYASPCRIGYVEHEASTWFEGYNHKLFYDKGALFANISRLFSRIYYLGFLSFISKNASDVFKESISYKDAYKIMVLGGKEFCSRKI
ncbi:MAG: glycosyltransferase family A protein [Ruminiclostridium sp.]